MKDFTQLPAVGLDYAGAKATPTPASSLGPAEMLPPHIAAIIDAKAQQATKTFTENSALAGAKDGKSVQQQVQEQLGVMEPWNQFEQAVDPVQDIAKRNATGNPLPDQAGQVAPTAEEILLQSPQEWQALFGSQVPDTSGALAAYQQASANRPQMPDLGRPRVDQTQQFIASLGALFDPKNAGQIMDLPTQNAQTDYEYKVKDAMRRYQMNNQDYEAKVELAKAILQNAEKEAAQAIASNQTGYKEYAQNVRNTNDNNARDRQVAAAIAGRAEVANTNNASKEKIAGLMESGRWARMSYKTEADRDMQLGKDYFALAKMTPEGRRQWVSSNGGTPEEADAYGNATSSELLAAARATKIPYEIKALQSKVNVDDARAKQIVEATRFIGPSFKLKQDQLALNIQNVESLIEMRKAGIDLTKIRGDMLQKGVSSMNQAMRSSTYLLKTAQDEIRKIYETSGGNLSDSQKTRLEELTGAVKKNQDIIDELNMAQGFLAPVDPSQLFGGIMGDVPPLPVGPTGLTTGVPARTGAIGGGVAQTRPATQSQRSGGKGKGGTAPKVDPKRPGLRITNINGSVPEGN